MPIFLWSIVVIQFHNPVGCVGRRNRRRGWGGTNSVRSATAVISGGKSSLQRLQVGDQVVDLRRRQSQVGHLRARFHARGVVQPHVQVLRRHVEGVAREGGAAV